MASSKVWEKREKEGEKHILYLGIGTILSSFLFFVPGVNALPIVGVGSFSMFTAMAYTSHAQSKRFEESDAEYEANKILKEVGM